MLKHTIAFLAACASTAFAEDTPPPNAAETAAAPSENVVYDSAFFAQFSPSTALDMVARMPGFTIMDGGDRRGFSGAVGNVLVDGARPTAKSQSIRDILQRIPASQVVRIEILRGAATSGDASGQAVLANVVRTQTGGAGVWDVGAQLTSRDKPTFIGEGSWNGRAGQINFGIGGTYYETFRSLPGGRSIYDSQGALLERREDRSPRNYREYSMSAQMGAPLLGGRIDLTGEASGLRFDDLHSQIIYNPAGARTRDAIRAYNEEERVVELGANFERGFGGWDMSLVGLLTRRRFDSGETTRQIDQNFSLGTIVAQEQLRESGESIARASFARPLASSQRLEIGAEGAFNSLDAELNLTEDVGLGPVTAPLANSNTLIEETRGEVFAAYTWRLSERVSLDARLAREASTLVFTGDADQTVELSFWKPSVQISRDFGASNQARLRVYRDVGQLDFDDFVSAVSLNDDIINGGNPDLKPETSWRAEAGLDLRFSGGAALSLVYTRAWISDLADVVQIVIPSSIPGAPPIRYDAPGNIGDADSQEISINFSTPLEFLLQGASLTLEGEIFEASVVDPVTGNRRRFSGRNETELEVEFRQDIAAWDAAWGVSAERFSDSADFRFNEIDTEQEGPWVDLFVERSFGNDTKLTFKARNIADGEIRRQRLFYAGDRSGALAKVENRLRHFENGPWYELSLSGTF